MYYRFTDTTHGDIFIDNAFRVILLSKEGVTTLRIAVGSNLHEQQVLETIEEAKAILGIE